MENKYSRYKPDSLVSIINTNSGKNIPVELDKETLALMEYATIAHQISNGLFDITSGVYRHTWSGHQTTIPSKSAINLSKKLVGWPLVKPSDSSIDLPAEGMEIDFGGIVKEYAADCLIGILQRSNIKHGIVDLGGDISAVGPHPDSSPWKILIKDPSDPTRAVAELPLMSGGIASSGDYERFIEIEGERYCHIINPLTGWPVKGLSAVSVWAPRCVIAGTMATTAMLKGKSGISWLRENEATFVAVDSDFNVHN